MRLLILLVVISGLTTQAQQVKQMTLVDIPNLNKNLKCLELDQYGYLWIGADEGLYRFNGVSLDTINIPLVKDLEITHEGKLLAVSDVGFYHIESSSSEIAFHKLYSASTIQKDSSIYFPKEIFVDNKDRVWIGALDEVLVYSGGVFERFSIDMDQTRTSLLRSFLFTEDGFHTVWAITYDGVLMYYDESSNQFRKVETPVRLNEVSSMISIENVLYINSGGGVFELIITKEKRISELQKLDIPAQVLMLERDGSQLFSASFDGLIIDPVSQKKQFSIPNGQIEIIDMKVMQDALWVLSDEQIFFGRDYPVLQLPFSNKRSSFSVSKRRNLYVSDGSSVKSVFSDYKGVNSEVLYEISDNSYINSTMVRDSLLYFTTSGGVYKYNLHLKKKERVFHIKNNQNLWLNELFLDSEDHLWVFSNNLTAHKEGLPTVLSFDENDTVYKRSELYEARFARLDRNGKTYFAGDSAFLAYLVNGNISEVPLAFADARKPTIHDLAFMEDSLLLATEIGLFSMAYSGETRDSLRLIAEGKITSVIVDTQQHIWFCDATGINKMKGSDIISISDNSGLPSSNILTRGLLMNGKNDLWANTSKGVVKIDIDNVNIKTPRPFLDMLLVDQERTLFIDDNIIGSFTGDNLLEFELASLTFPQNTLTSRLRLFKDGTLHKTLYGGKTISIFGLEAGSYELSFQVLQEGMSWSEPLRYQMNIVVPWYETTLGRILMIMVIAACIYGLVLLNSRRLKSSNKRLEELVSKRSHELNEQKEKLIESQSKVIQQQKEILENNEVLFETKYALNQSEIKYLGLKKNQLKDELELKNKQLTTHALSIVRKNQQLMDVLNALNETLKKPKSADFNKEVNKIKKDIELSMSQDRRWEEFKMYFEQVHTDFNAKLKLNFSDLTPNDLKHCALAKLNMSLEDCAAIMGVSAETVRITRFRIQKKMKLSSQQAFLEFLITI